MYQKDLLQPPYFSYLINFKATLQDILSIKYMALYQLQQTVTVHKQTGNMFTVKHS